MIHRRLSVIFAIHFMGACLLATTVLQAQTHSFEFPRHEFPLTNLENSAVDLSDILSGGPPRDGIPAIDSPEFVSVQEASDWLQDSEPVIAFSLDGETRAYPIQILMYHEIVNDTVAGHPVAVTFCPLCNASIVFDRKLIRDGMTTVLDFGTTGRLRKSDLIMYDRQTESWWQQFSGRGLIGDYADTVLKQLPSQIVSFKTFKDSFASSRVLSRDTGFVRSYGNNPYRGYDAIDNNPFLFDGETDPRLPAMERVLSIVLDDATHLIPLSALQNVPLLDVSVENRRVIVFAATSANSALDGANIAQSRLIPAAAAFDPTLDNTTLTFKLEDGHIVDEQTGSRWDAFGRAIDGELVGSALTQLDTGVHFAFAWLAFDPEATIVALNTDDSTDADEK